MIFLDQTYFEGELKLPHVTKDAGVGIGAIVQTVSENNLHWFIAKYEPVFLAKILGKALYRNFTEGISEDSPSSIWTHLRDALFFESEGYKISAVANYVYFYVKRDGRKQVATQGDVVGKMTYADNVSDHEKLVKAWNNMCDLLDDFKCFLVEHWDDYREYADGFPCFSILDTRINVFGI